MESAPSPPSPPPPPPPPQPPPPPPAPPPPSLSELDLPSTKESLIARYKPIWRLLLISNLALGAYMFAQAGKRDKIIATEHGAAKEGKVAKEVSPSQKIDVDALIEESLLPSLTIEPIKIQEPVPEEQQRELFEWILEEKRKVKPNNDKAKKQIDEEKALLKEFIRAKSIPDL